MASDQNKLVAVSRGAGIETWRMQFAPVNALDPAMIGALAAELARASIDQGTSVIVLTSGLRIFSAGADASWMAGIVNSEGLPALLERFNAAMDSFRDLCVSIRRSPLLVIAAMNGHTLAGGLELAAACDLRFSSSHEKVQIGVPEMDLFGAMPTGGGGVQFLTRLMGPSRALQFILDAKPVDPRTAYSMGLIDRLVEPEALLAEAEEFATQVARKAGRVGVAAAKRSTLGGAELPLYEAVELDRSLHWDAMRRGNFLPGVEAFVTKFGASK